MKKIIIGIIVVGMLIAISFLSAFYFLNKDSGSSCQGSACLNNNQLIPNSQENTNSEKNNEQIDDSTGKIIVTSPKPGDKISSPTIITGEARGSWYFEASFPIELLDEMGGVLSRTTAQAQGDWMTENFVPFRAELTYNASSNTEAMLIFKKDNPSGLPENDELIKIPVLLAASSSDNIEKLSTTTVKIFFGNSKLNPEMLDCSKTYPVDRVIAKTEAVGRAALEELLKGPTDSEKQTGFFTSINSNVNINSLKIDNGIANVDFDKQLENAVGGSCRVASISAQIKDTLKQFPTVKEVIISIEGRTDDILQP